MKSEKELCILINLLNSRHLEGGILTKPVPVTIRELETELGYSFDNKQIRDWFKKLLLIEGMKCIGEKSTSKGQTAKIYLFDGKILEDKLQNNSEYQMTWKYFQRKAFLGQMEK